VRTNQPAEGRVKAFKFRLYPTCPQRDRLSAMLRDHCELYNAALEERREAWRRRRVSVGVYDQAAQIKEIRRARPDLAVWSFTSKVQTLRRLDKAFQAFFRRVKAGETPGYPRFRPVGRFNSVDLRQGDGAKFDTLNCSAGHAVLHVKGVGAIKVRLHRRLPDGVKLGQVTVKREGVGQRAHWYVVLPVEVEVAPLPKTGRTVGIDLGVVHLLTASEPICGLTDANGFVRNPRHAHAAADRLVTTQRAMARCKRGSRRRDKVRAHIVALHGKVQRRRVDGARKAALALVQHADVIVLEDLQASGMVRRAKPVVADDGTYARNGAAAKSSLNRSIHDAGWGVLTRAILAKAEEAGREVVFVNPANTSRRCARCGHTAAGNRVTQAKFECLACGHIDHADRNAAQNILRAGTAHREAAAEREVPATAGKVHGDALPWAAGTRGLS
jgi:putative transposase